MLQIQKRASFNNKRIVEEKKLRMITAVLWLQWNVTTLNQKMIASYSQNLPFFLAQKPQNKFDEITFFFMVDEKQHFLSLICCYNYFDIRPQLINIIFIDYKRFMSPKNLALAIALSLLFFLVPINTQTCSSTQYNDGATCIQCYSAIPNCITCSNGLICDICYPGHMGNTCETCQVGYWMNETVPFCDPCNMLIIGCSICFSNTTCDICESNYKPSGQICQYYDARARRVACQSNQYESAGSCILCNTTIPSCATCSSDGSSCNQCDPQYGLFNSSTTCTTCSSIYNNCITCDSSNGCLQCDSYSYYPDSGTCVPCNQTMPGCANCPNSTCDDCQSGYYLARGVCYLCNITIPNCLECSSTTCLKCETGYYPDTTTCLLCNSTLNHCQTCLNNTNCTMCDLDYTVIDGDCSLCSAIIPNCKQCSNASVCTECVNGSYDLSTNCQTIQICVNGTNCTNETNDNSLTKQSESVAYVAVIAGSCVGGSIC